MPSPRPLFGLLIGAVLLGILISPAAALSGIHSIPEFDYTLNPSGVVYRDYVQASLAYNSLDSGMVIGSLRLWLEPGDEVDLSLYHGSDITTAHISYQATSFVTSYVAIDAGGQTYNRTHYFNGVAPILVLYGINRSDNNQRGLGIEDGETGTGLFLPISDIDRNPVFLVDYNATSPIQSQVSLVENSYYDEKFRQKIDEAEHSGDLLYVAYSKFKNFVEDLTGVDIVGGFVESILIGYIVVTTVLWIAKILILDCGVLLFGVLECIILFISAKHASEKNNMLLFIEDFAGYNYDLAIAALDFVQRVIEFFARVIEVIRGLIPLI